MGATETHFGSCAGFEVNSPSAITLENNGKFRPQPRAENGLCREVGGGTGTGVEYSLGAKALFFNEWHSRTILGKHMVQARAPSRSSIASRKLRGLRAITLMRARSSNSECRYPGRAPSGRRANRAFSRCSHCRRQAPRRGSRRVAPRSSDRDQHAPAAPRCHLRAGTDRPRWTR